MSAPVVFVHGMRTSSSMWDPQRERLAAEGWRTLAPDLPGHGALRGEPFTLAGAVDVITEALRGCAEPAHLVGCSLGGMLAIHTAAAAQVRSLVAAGCSTQPSARTAGGYGALISVFDRLGGEAAIRRVLGAEGARAYLRGGRAGLDVVADAMRAIARLDLRADLARVGAPVTILNGRFDQFRVQERAFARAARVGRLLVMPYGGHMVNLTHPARYTEALRRLLVEAEAFAPAPQ